jgi:VWFA-related protein
MLRTMGLCFHFQKQRRLLSFFFALATAAWLAPSSFAQQPQKPPADDVLRVNTELVQTAITVVDKDGRFVDGLSRDQFSLAVDGKPRQISFFERVTAGSPREAQINARPNGSPSAISAPVAATNTQGRTIVFFIDDSHLSPDSLNRTRQMLREFVDHQMSASDSVAIVSASGQVGFLQQFTNNRQVLEAAMSRLSPVQYDARGFGTGSTKMTEYLALNIDTEKSDNRILGFYVGECMKQNMPPKRSPAYSTLVAALRATCETDVKTSARAILMQAAQITQNMYASLESLMRSSARAPGRKLAFFISDGFLMDAGPHAAGLRDKLDRIIDAATRAGVVVYTIDARGLSTSAVVDAANSRPLTGSADPFVGTAQIGEIAATQDAMNALAGDTGGRALRNMNFFDRWVNKVLDETSNYYLIAWRPDTEAEKVPKFRHVQISIANRPDLAVRAPRGYVDGPSAIQLATAEAKQKSLNNQSAKTAEAELGAALADYYPSHSLPTLLSLTYLNTPKNEMLLTSSVQISSGALNYGSDGRQKATLKLAGVILNDKGKIAASFKNQLNVNPLRAESDTSGVIYNEHTPLAPGIYQVRVAARDENSGNVGSAMQWIVIPDLATRRLHLSSVLLGGKVLESAASKDAPPQVQFSVDHRFARSSPLSYWIFVYNAKRDASGAPNLLVKSEVWRDGKLVTSAPARTIKSGVPDPDRIPFAEQILLASLARGRYELVVTITDNVGATSATQTIDFEVS